MMIVFGDLKLSHYGMNLDWNMVGHAKLSLIIYKYYFFFILFMFFIFTYGLHAYRQFEIR